MKQWKWVTLCVAVGMCLPQVGRAQGMANDIQGLQGVLDQLYDEMIPLCSKLIDVGRGLAGFAALWYIAYRVWRHLANAEPIDFYPLFRPFVLGFLVMIFPSVIAMINGVLKPTVSATGEMVKGSDAAITALLKQKEDMIKTTDSWQMYVGESGNGDRDKWYKYTHPDDPTGEDEGIMESVGNDIKFAMSKASYNFRNSVKQWMSEVLQVLYQAAALCINTLRTFNLIVLAILGPLVFGLAVFDGFQHSLTSWLGRYINMYLWLPIANIFGAIIGKIQENMLKLDMQQIQQAGDTFFSPTDVGYLIFMIIGIVGYFTVPSVANYVVHVHGGGGLTERVTRMTSSTATSAVGGAGSIAQGAASGAAGWASAPGAFIDGYTSSDIQKNSNSIASILGRQAGGGSQHQKDKISGKS